MNTSSPIVVTGTGAVPLGGDPYATIRKRGTRYRDLATRLALAVGDQALRSAGLLVDDSTVKTVDPVAVVASSRLGNADTVARIARTLCEEGVAGTSPMDLPNVSPNVVATAVAIAFGLRGPNLLVTDGRGSVETALRVGCRLVSAGRAGAVLVIGVEPPTDIAELVLGVGRTGSAVGLVVEPADRAQARGITPLCEASSGAQVVRDGIGSVQEVFASAWDVLADVSVLR